MTIQPNTGAGINRKRFVWPDWTGELAMATPFIGAGLTAVAVIQDKPRYIILGGGVFTLFSAFVAGFDMAGDRPEFYELLYEDCKKQGYWTDKDGVRLDSKEGPLAHMQSSSDVWVSTGADLCETEFNGASAFFYASAATLAWGLYRASEKGL